MQIRIRKATGKDTVYLHDLDVKTFEHSWLDRDWANHAKNGGFVDVITANKVPIGMLVCDVQGYKALRLLHIYKVTINTRFRGNNYGRHLMARAYARGVANECDTLAISVPSSMVTGDDSCAGWLAKMDLAAKETLKADQAIYGRSEDIYLFMRPIRR